VSGWRAGVAGGGRCEVVGTRDMPGPKGTMSSSSTSSTRKDKTTPASPPTSTHDPDEVGFEACRGRSRRAHNRQPPFRLRAFEAASHRRQERRRRPRSSMPEEPRRGPADAHCALLGQAKGWRRAALHLADASFLEKPALLGMRSDLTSLRRGCRLFTAIRVPGPSFEKRASSGGACVRGRV